MTAACATTASQSALSVMWKTVSEDCNLACDYCYYSRVGGKIGPKINRIEPKLLEKLIREYMEIIQGTAAFAWQGGEPLLAGLDFFKEVVYLQAKYAKPNTIISNSVQTNATLINEDWAKFFRHYNFLVGVSIDGPKDIHDARRVTRNGAGSFDRVMRGVDVLRSENVDFNILTVIHQGNVDRARDLFDFYRQQGFYYVQFIPCMDFRAQETGKQGKYLITPEEYGRFLCDAFDVWYNDGQPEVSIRFFDNMLSMFMNQEPELCIHRKSCPTTLILEQNGDAFPCDFYMSDDYKLGNVGSHTITEIMGNYVYGNFLSMKPSLPDKCQKCEFQKFCHGGCPRNRVWGNNHEVLDVDYFCESYLAFYRHASERMGKISRDLRVNMLSNYLGQGNSEPDRNAPCICGSGKKYKKCCRLLRDVTRVDE